MATYFSAQTGNWSTTTTWLTASVGVYSISSALPAGQPPQSFGKDKIIIRPNHIVTYDVNGCFGDETSYFGQGNTTALANQGSIISNSIILSGGTLKASRTVNTELTAQGNIVIGLSGVLDWGTNTDPLTTNSNITLHYMTELSALSSSVAAAGIYLYGATATTPTALDYYRNGIYINGKSKTRNTTLSVSAANGASVLTLASPISTLGWNVGDRLVVATETSFLSAVNQFVTSIPSTVLSATYIQSFTGNQITISPALNTFRSAGTNIGNFTSNVNIKSYNPLYPAYGIFVNGSMAFTVDISNIKLESLSYGNGVTPVYGNVGWQPYLASKNSSIAAYTGTPVAPLTLNTPVSIPNSNIKIFPIKGVVVDNFTSATTQALGVCPPATYAAYVNGKYTDYITLDDWAVFQQNVGSMFGFNFNSLCNAILKNSVIYRSTYGLSFSTTFPYQVNIDNCVFDNLIGNIVNVNGLNISITNSKFRTPIPLNSTANYISLLESVQNLSLKNCTFVSNNSAGPFFQPQPNAVGNMVMSNCSYYNLNTPLTTITKSINGYGNVTGQSAQINLYQPNNSIYDYRRFNYFYYAQTDLNVRKRGITSYRIKPDVANVQFYNYFTIPATINTQQRIKGSLRFDSTYGTSYPPSISFVGAGVNTTFTCVSTADIWQDFDVTLNPSSTDDITLTITCQSSSTAGYVYLDGLPIYPFIQNVRHYGYVFDNNINRTTDSYVTSSEQAISTLTTINSLNNLYDISKYWTVTNIINNAYTDLVFVDGDILNYNSYNIVINPAASDVFSYNSNTITFKSTSLTSSDKFTQIKTTGNITINPGAVVDSTIIIRSSNYDSELVYAGADNITLYPTYQDALNNTNPGPTTNNGILRYLYGQTLSGVQMSGNFYAKWNAGTYSDVYSGVIDQPGTIVLGDLSNQAGLAIAVNNLKIINTGIQKASILVPHSTNVGYKDGLTSQIQNILDEQLVLNDGVKKASRLIPHTTNL